MCIRDRLLAVTVGHVQPSTVIFCPLQVDRVELVGLIIRFMSRASFADTKLAVHPVSGTAVTLNGCMPSFCYIVIIGVVG